MRLPVIKSEGVQWADAHQLGRYADVGSQSQMVHNSHLSWANLGWQNIGKHSKFTPQFWD